MLLFETNPKAAALLLDEALAIVRKWDTQLVVGVVSRRSWALGHQRRLLAALPSPYRSVLQALGGVPLELRGDDGGAEALDRAAGGDRLDAAGARRCTWGQEASPLARRLESMGAQGSVTVAWWSAGSVAALGQQVRRAGVDTLLLSGDGPWGATTLLAALPCAVWQLGAGMAASVTAEVSASVTKTGAAGVLPQLAKPQKRAVG